MGEDVALSIFGLLVGLTGATLGTGAAPFLVPLLVFGRHLPLDPARGTALAIGFLTVASGVTASVQHHRADCRLVPPLAWAGMAGAILGARFVSGLTPARFAELFGVVLLGSLAWLLLGTVRAWLSALPAGRSASAWSAGALGPVALTWRVKAILTALLAGGISSSLGVGAGVVLVPFLAGQPGLSLPVAVAIAQVADAPVTFSGSVWSLLQGHLNFRLVAYVGAGGMVGAQLGAWFLPRCPRTTWGLAYGLTCLGLGIAALVHAGLPWLASVAAWVLLSAERASGVALLSLPGPLGALIVAATGAAALMSVQLVRAVWRKGDPGAIALAALGVGAFAADFLLGHAYPSLHRAGAYGLAGVYFANLLYALVRRDRVSAALGALATGLLAVAIALARVYFARP